MADTHTKDLKRKLDGTRRVRYSHAPVDVVRELSYEQDFLENLVDDGTTNRREAREDALTDVLHVLTTLEWTCLYLVVIQGGYAVDGNKGTNWRLVQRLIGTNPESGLPICSKTVKRATHRALDKLRTELGQLPTWQQLMLGLPEQTDLERVAATW